MKAHPVADIFPAMSEPEFQALKADIAEHGVREPIWIWHEQLLDGRHRERACDELGILCPFREYEGDEAGLVAFVVSLNLKRRHLDESQRSIVAARIATLPAHRPDGSAPVGAVTQDEAAGLMNVGRRSVQRAREVLDEGATELLIDEKARFKDYGDILLEYWSDERRKTPGWVCKPLRADFIAYAVVPSGWCYLLPVPQLQAAWVRHGEYWIEEYYRIDAKNNGYVTVSVGVPIRVLFAAIGQQLRITFTPMGKE